MRTRFPILRVVAKLLIPYIILFALYVQFHGDYGPGGGFQAGVILAAAVICYGLVFGLDSARRVVPPAAIEFFIALGVLIFAGTGFVPMFVGDSDNCNFLDYDALTHHIGETTNGHDPVEAHVPTEAHGDETAAGTHSADAMPNEHHLLPSGQHLGLLVIELGVGICVSAVMISIFYAFAGRDRIA